MKLKLTDIPIIKNWVRKLNNLNERKDWVIGQLKSLPTGCVILDAGCGSQQFRQYASHLSYKAQDFGQYSVDEKKMIGSDGVGKKDGYKYGDLDYVGDIWAINEKDQFFDAILCTEVFEHIPFPVETVKEFCRLLKQGGKLILTAPSNCLRHMDPYYYYSGFSDRWFERILTESGFSLDIIEPVGDYYSWLSVEMMRTAKNHGAIAKILLLPSFVYYFTKRKSKLSVDTLCMGYHVLATKR